MNFYKALLGLLPQQPLQVGDVSDVSGGVATVTLPDGGTVQARGDVSIGDRVYFRNGAVEGTAPALLFQAIDI